MACFQASLGLYTPYPGLLRWRLCHTCGAVSRYTLHPSPRLAALGYLREGLHIVDSPDDKRITPVPYGELVTGKGRHLEASTRGDQVRNDQLTPIVLGQLLQPAGHMHRVSHSSEIQSQAAPHATHHCRAGVDAETYSEGLFHLLYQGQIEVG